MDLNYQQKLILHIDREMNKLVLLKQELEIKHCLVSVISLLPHHLSSPVCRTTVFTLYSPHNRIVCFLLENIVTREINISSVSKICKTKEVCCDYSSIDSFF